MLGRRGHWRPANRRRPMTPSMSAAIALLAALGCSAVQASETYTYDSNPILGFGLLS